MRRTKSINQIDLNVIDIDVDNLEFKTDICFEGELPTYNAAVDDGNVSHIDKDHDIHIATNIPSSFSWDRVDDVADDADLRYKKGLISPVADQKMCGSCWAVCLATTISDCFVVCGTTKYPPSISATYIMSKLPRSVHDGCNGGNPAKAVKLLENVHLVDKSCMDYKWCSEDDICSSQEASKHFKSKLGDVLNAKIPKTCKDPTIEYYGYLIDKNSTIYSVNKARYVNAFRNVIKTHIYEFGPVIAGFAVRKDFTRGNFTVDGGVYLEDYASPIVGLHAVSIVGWGMRDDQLPYWRCRNSWGKDWGKDEGYFNIAMYPHNTVSQLDKQVVLPGGGVIGSVIMVRACLKPTLISTMSEKLRELMKRRNKFMARFLRFLFVAIICISVVYASLLL